jgi:hypothetical protein
LGSSHWLDGSLVAHTACFWVAAALMAAGCSSHAQQWPEGEFVPISLASNRRGRHHSVAACHPCLMDTSYGVQESRASVRGVGPTCRHADQLAVGGPYGCPGTSFNHHWWSAHSTFADAPVGLQAGMVVVCDNTSGVTHSTFLRLFMGCSGQPVHSCCVAAQHGV